MADEETSPNPQGGSPEPPAGQPAAKDTPTTPVQDGGTSSGSKIADMFPKDYRHLVEGYGDMKTFMADVEQAFTNKGVQVPGENASDEEVAEFFAKLGKPESKDGYDLQPPEGVQENQALKDWFLEAAHAAHLTKAQAQALYEKWNTLQNDRQTASEEEVMAQLREEWGDQTEVNTKRAERVAELMGGEEFKSWLNETGAGNDTRLIKAMYQIAELVGEDTLERGSGKTAGSGQQQHDEFGRPMVDMSASFPEE